MELAYKLEKAYSASGLPALIADGELKILWENNIGGAIPDLGGSADIVFDGVRPVTGLVTREINGELLTFNVIKVGGGGNDGSYYVIELISSRGLDGGFGGSVSAEAVRGYIGYICSKIRTAVGNIISVTDRLFEDISAGVLDPSRAAEEFDLICESAIELEREIGYPDRIYSLTAPEKPDDIIVLDREMTALVSVLKSSLKNRCGISVRISEDYDRDIFFRMNTDSLETAVLSMTAECCGGGYPERIIFSARRSGRDRAEIAVMSLDISGGVKSKSPVYERSFNRSLLAEYIYDVLGLKNGAKFSKEKLPGGFVCRMNIEALPRGASVFAEKFVDGSGRQRRIEDKVAFFFGDIPVAEGRRYTSRGFGERVANDSEPNEAHNIYREDIENEETKI